MNSAPLSESRPSSALGKRPRHATIAALTVAWLRLSKPYSSTQRVLTSIMSRLLRCSPWVVSPQCATRSTSMKPGWASSHCAKVRTGMACLSNLPGLVVVRPWGRTPRRAWASRRSAVAGLSVRSKVRFSESSFNSPCRSSASTNVGRPGTSRLPQMQLAVRTGPVYLTWPPRRGPRRRIGGWFNSWMAYLRW